MLRAMRRLLGLVLLAVACKDDPNKKVNALCQELAEPTPLLDSKLTACPTDGSCLDALSRDLGSTRGYSAVKPDQASVAAVAVLVARDGHGDWATGLDEWLEVMRKGKGPGADALRLAVSMRLAKVLPTWAHPLTDAELAGFFRDVGRAIPGSCTTYALLGAGKDDASLPIENQSDHAACVQKDLGRGGGPGGTYGHGPWRAATALLSLAKETLSAIETGAPLEGAKYKDTTNDRVKTARDAASHVGLVPVEPPPGRWAPQDDEAHGDGGLQGAPRDAGRD